MEIQDFKNLFNSEFYDKSYQRWRVDSEKAGKDIIGEQYESFRRMYYQSCGFTIGNGKKVFGSSYNCDTVVKKGDKVLILEEDKGHYIDSCFLGRAISNAAEIFSECLDKGIEIPFFAISSPTKMNNYDSICDRRFKLYREDIVTLLNSKFLYFPLSENGRIPKEKYFETENSCFNLSDELILNQNKFIETLK
jgi:hypothetical protein